MNSELEVIEYGLRWVKALVVLSILSFTQIPVFRRIHAAIPT